MSTLNEEQRQALNLILSKKSRIVSITGAGGTGKSYVLSRLPKNIKIAYTAPSHKALSVLRDGCKDVEPHNFMTIHSFMGLVLNESNGNVSLDKMNKPKAKYYEYLVIDESSMLSDDMVNRIDEMLRSYRNLYVIYMGDACQLPPVKETDSTAFVKSIYNVNLIKQERQRGNSHPITPLLNDLRLSIADTSIKINFSSYQNKNENGGVTVIKDRKLFNEWIKVKFCCEDYNPKNSIVAYTNAVVDNYNNLIHLTKNPNSKNKYDVGDLVCVQSHINVDAFKYEYDFIQLRTEDRFKIKTIEPAIVNRVLGGKPFKLNCLLVNGMYCVEDRNEFISWFDHKATLLKTNRDIQKFTWGELYDIKNGFADIRLCYATTVHKAQGSTYDNVFVDAANIMTMRESKKHNKPLFIYSYFKGFKQCGYFNMSISVETISYEESLEMARRFLTTIDSESDFFTFQVFNDDKTKDVFVQPEWIHGTIDHLWGGLARRNMNGAGIFVMINEGNGQGRNNASIIRPRAVMQELDDGVVANDPIEPHIVVESSPGKYHKYWLSDDLTKDDYSSVMLRMIQDYGSDKSVKDLCRVMRLPGFFHMKNPKKPHLVRVIHESGGLPYDRDVILSAFPPIDKMKPNIKPVTININTNTITGATGNNDCEVKIIRLMINAKEGERHAIRLKAGRLAGGFIASGLMVESDAIELLISLSDKISGINYTSPKELKAIMDGIEHGKMSPINNNVNYSDDNDKKNLFIENNDEEDFEVQDWNPDISGEIDYIIPFDCVARDIQQWILSISVYPQPAISYAAAMCVVSTIVGRSIRFDNIKGNMMFICMAESGEGKDLPFKAAESIIDACGMGDDVYSKMASGAALMDALSASNSMLLHIDEMGNYLSAINGRGSDNYAKEVVGIITECYTSADKFFRGKKTKGHDAMKIIEPNLCVLGMSTERQVFDGLRTADIADGSIARYMMLFGLNGVLPVRLPRNTSNTVPRHIVDKLLSLRDKYNYTLFDRSVQLDISHEYNDAKYELMLKMKKLGNEMRSNPDRALFVPFYNRVAVRSVQGAMLIDQCKSIDVLDWCANLDIKCGEVFMKKFLHLGSDNDNERLSKLLQSKIKEAGKNGITAKNLIKVTQQIQPHVKKALIEELHVNNVISIKQAKVNGSQKPSTVYYWNK